MKYLRSIHEVSLGITLVTLAACNIDSAHFRSEALKHGASAERRNGVSDGAVDTIVTDAIAAEEGSSGAGSGSDNAASENGSSSPTDNGSNAAPTSNDNEGQNSEGAASSPGATAGQDALATTILTTTSGSDASLATPNAGIPGVSSPSDDQKRACAIALTGTYEPAKVAAISGRETSIDPDNIVVLALSGGENVTLSAPIAVKGFCIFTQGNSNAKIGDAFTFANLGVFSGGSSSVSFDLADGSRLENVFVIGKGNPAIGIYGPGVRCELFQKRLIGNASLSCAEMP